MPVTPSGMKTIDIIRPLDKDFFFSSMRRHTRWTGDWSSDVCSSDLLDNASWVNVRLNRTLYVNGKPAVQFNLSLTQDALSSGNEQKVIRATEDLGAKKHDIIM